MMDIPITVKPQKTVKQVKEELKLNRSDREKLDIDDRPLLFGVHKGKTPNEIAKIHSNYIVFLYQNNIKTLNQPVVSRLLYITCLPEDAKRTVNVTSA